MNTTGIINLKAQELTLFIDPPTENVSKVSAKAYRSDREAYLKFCESENLSIGDPTSLESYRDSLLGQSYKPASINRKLSAAKSGLIGYLVATYGRERAAVLKQAYTVVKAVKVSKNEHAVRPEAILNDGEIERLITGADPKTALIIRFLSKTGCRISETLNVRRTDVRLTDDAVEILVLGKGMKARKVFLSKNDYQMIADTFKGEKYLFETSNHHRYDRVNVTKRIGRLSEAILGKHISAHSLRHSFATRMIQRTQKLKATSEYLGHQSVAFTMSTYVHENFSLDELL